jgi:Large extracellular alpha-helical protein
MESQRVASCNILASNIGVIAKKNSANKLWIIANDILTTDPISGANVTIYNYQLQKIASSKTNSEGISEIECKGAPFIVEVEFNNQKSFVKVLEGESQSLSKFDVGGKKIEKGLKGFIYGERGVWRPGDTLNVTFILDKKHSNIPDNHPVTFTLYNPNGQFYTKQVATNSENGFYAFKVATNSDDPTGLWNGYVSVGGVSFYKGFRIETIKPNRLKINLDLPSVIRASNGLTNIKLASKWLTGVNASNLKAKIEVSLTKTITQFKNYSNYIFNNPCTDFETSTLNVFEGELDANGEKIIPFNTPNANRAPGMLNAKFTTQVYEPGGNASINVSTVPYSPFKMYVGVNLNAPDNKILETDKLHTFNVVTLDSEGNLTDNNNLEYKIYKVDWTWWWENRDESFSKYVNNTSYVPEKSGRLTTVNGKANIEFKVEYPSWGRYFVYVYDRNSGHASGGTIYIDWPSYRGRSNKQDPSGEKMLTFSLDKKEYSVGDKATAYIPTAADGVALISFENGSTILKQEWIKVSSKEDTKYTFDITADMVPNAYLSITLLQPHSQMVNNLPIRMYGVVPIIAKDNNTILKPIIKMPDSVKPEEEFEVIVNEESGKEMTYTLAIVDEGLLDLTNYVTPNPWDEFYRKEALDITTWDMYDYVFGASNGSFASLFSVGGDVQLNPSQAKANRFKPVVKFIGPTTIKKGEKGRHRIKLPMYLGAVKAMVVAGGNGAYGKADKSAFVKTPLMLQTTLPRVLSVNEEILVPVNIFAMEKNIKDVNVSIKITGDGVVTDGPDNQSVTFNETGDKLIYFKIRTTNKVGVAKINVSASSGSNTSFENVEIEVRNPNPIVTINERKWLEAGKEVLLPYSFIGATENRNMTLEVMRIPSINYTERMNFLYEYQHNCTEQITSKALPLLFADKFSETTNSEQENIKQNVTNAIKMLYSRQLNNGGFAYWPSSSVADEWISSYVGMFLTLAKEKGYPVNSGVISKWKSFQKSAARNWKNQTNKGNYFTFENTYIQAFRLYSLALAGSPEIGSMNRMNVIKDLPIQTKWRLAAAYAVAGKKSIANELIFSTTLDVSSYSSENSIYGSKTRDQAMILETLILLDRTEQAVELAKQIAEDLNKETHFTTQSTAFTLYAMSYLADKMQGTLNFEMQQNKEKTQNVASAKTIWVKKLSPKQESGEIKIKNRGDKGIFVELVSKVQLLKDTLPSMSNNLRLNVKYVSLNGSPIDITNLKQGDEFKAIVEVTNIGFQNYSNLALTHIIPAGWEIFNQDLFSAESSNSSYSYRDIRDDKVLTYFDLAKNTSKQFEVRLQATYLGDFNLPAIICEAMYDSSVFARLQGGRTVVSK